jgi:hypothetical protein
MTGSSTSGISVSPEPELAFASSSTLTTTPTNPITRRASFHSDAGRCSPKITVPTATT